jgi:hypothetical protein
MMADPLYEHIADNFDLSQVEKVDVLAAIGNSWLALYALLEARDDEAVQRALDHAAATRNDLEALIQTLDATSDTESEVLH